MIDLGTGLRPLGYELEARIGAGRAVEMTTLLSHLHWDHIVGLPFCTPLLREGGRMEVYGPGQDCGTLKEVMDKVVQPPYFPVDIKGLHGQIEFHDVADDDVAIGSAKVKMRVIPHVGTTLGFRVEVGGSSAAFICDHQASADMMSVSPAVLELCDGADLVVHDAQYTDSEYELKATWGHSTISYAVHVAAEAGAKRLALFHHDPTHGDDDMDQILGSARDLPEAGKLDEVLAAAEGMVVDLGSN